MLYITMWILCLEKVNMPLLGNLINNLISVLILLSLEG